MPHVEKIVYPVFGQGIRLFDLLHRIYMRMVAYINPVKDCRTVFDSRVRCNAREFMQRRIRFFGIIEHNLTYYTLRNLRKNDVYVDIGANIGYYSLLASRCVGKDGKVIAVEADRETFKLLQQNLELNAVQNVLALNVAATATACRVATERNDPHNIGHNTIKVGVGDIEGLSFSEIVGNDIGKVRFIKIDIEGSEAPVLTGILDALPNLPSDLIVASEIGAESAMYVTRFIEAGFQAYAIQNIYTVDYYLIRSYLSRYGEDVNIHILPVDHYEDTYTDYVFERGQAARTLKSVI